MQELRKHNTILRNQSSLVKNESEKRLKWGEDEIDKEQ